MAEAASEKSIFLHAAGLDSPVARAAYLDEACRHDPSIRMHVDELLAAHDRLGGATPPTAGLDPSMAPLGGHEAGTVIGGRFKLLEVIGEGGMGTVWLAEQTEPVRRKVALKLIKSGMDSKQVLARFQAERQALALMDHPNIARVLDGGVTGEGRPYFVMELVKGVPITNHCDDFHLTPKERLELFLPVCQAVQHAHQKGIIHRDLKPNNVLVATYEARPVVKVIDFGVAKAAGQQLTEKTLFTGFGAVVGTLEYMSPEQAELNNQDIDTRSDIYSLGVMLYELLTGTTPLTRNRLKETAFVEMLRVIREEEPPRPSTRLSESKDSLASISAQRHTEPAKLTRLVRGELDWIVMKALEKDRNRRYETANGFAADVLRYLNDETVQACPPSAGYRLRKFARRNKTALVTAWVVVATLFAGTGVAIWQAARATRAMAVALGEKERADQEATTAKRITESLQQLVGSLDPDAAKGPDYTARQLLDDYAPNLEEKLADRPEAAADLQAILGRAYACVGQRDKARKHLGRTLELLRSAFGDQHSKYADGLVDYARPDACSGSSELAAGEVDLRRALAIYRARGVGGRPVIRALKTLSWNLGEQASAGAQAKRGQIEPVLNEALAEAAHSPDVEFPETASIYHALAGVKIDHSQYADAERFAQKAVAMHLKLHKDSLETAWGYLALGEALRPQGKFSGALAAEKHALTMMRRSLPPEHANIAYMLAAVNHTLDGADKSGALIGMFPSVAALGEWDALFRELLATTKPGKLNYADPVLEAIKGLVRFSEFYAHLGRDLAASGKVQEAEASRQKASHLLESLQAQLAAKPDVLPYVYGYGAIALAKAGQPEQAEELCRKLLDPTTPKTGGLCNNLAWLLVAEEIPAQRDPALAIELAKKAVKLAQKALDSSPQDRNCRNTLGVAHYRTGNWPQAISDLEADGGTGFDWFFLAMAYWRLGEPVKARQWFDRAVHWMDESQPTNKDLARFRVEATELMHIVEQPKSVPKTK